MKATVLGLGLLTGGTALANANFGESPLYNPQHSYYGPPYYCLNYWNYNIGYPNYYLGYSYIYGYLYYGWYPGTLYPYRDSTAASHPYSKTNPNWIPYVGWR